MNFVAPLAQRRLFAGFEASYCSTRTTLAGTNLDGYFLANFSLLSQRVFRGLDLSVGVYNLFNTPYADPGAQEHRQPSIQQDGRNWRIKLAYVFGDGR
jgi:iron complex outermembrane receptor protein